ncbi:DUF2207 domain-containing protein [uncultured Parvimonas sp.]|uniref:DUF2207 family protein n=1 Tax=uncultured Parvimonas sp. TaxID=747372 RepID=UPI0028040B9F|nr:DUF2207 domain-containing protein [uncultured Parvimonas sp.]
MKNFRNFVKKFFVFSFILISILAIPLSNAFADDFYENKINVKINKDGSADIESIMDFKPTKGTEYYIPIENLGKSEIKDFKVSEILNGKEIQYESLSTWNTKASRAQKAKKSGIVKTSNGYELCFGFGEYKRNTFVLRYKVTNFVKLLNDSDMIFWKFVNDSLSAPPQKVSVIISKEDGKFDNTNSKIWAFGNKGKIEFIDGKIVFKTLEGLRSSNYVTILTQLNKGEIISGEKINKDFSYYKDMAFKGSSYVKKSSSNKNNQKLYKIAIKAIVFLLIGIFGTATAVTSSKKLKGGYKKGDFKGEYYRDIPEKEWWQLSHILKCAGFDGAESIIRAYFLKWIQGKVLIPMTEEKGFIFKKEVLSLKINNKIEYDFETTVERKLFSMVEKAARDDEILQENEFTSYLKKENNQSAFKSLQESMKQDSLSYARKYDLLEMNEKGKWTYKYNEKGKKFTEHLIKYYNYLKDFTLLSEREVSEIKVWKDLLIYATLFDVADEVEKQLKKLSPEFLENYDVDVNSLHTAMLYSHVFSNNFLDAYSKSVQKSSGGGGGFTSIGGGGGSFGGGSGGGTR